MIILTQGSRLAATAILLGSLACVSPASAQDQGTTPDTSTPDTSTTSPQTNAPAMMMHHGNHGAQGDMQQKVEDRIKTLHSKLKITQGEEAAWGAVAQAIRDNETNISALVHDRHQNAENMTALQDMDSYQKIAQAHADGLGKVLAAFTPLYNSMSDAQKANADKVFGTFEGHGHKHGMGAAKTPDNQ